MVIGAQYKNEFLVAWYYLNKVCVINAIANLL